jgi:hypothetical protein
MPPWHFRTTSTYLFILLRAFATYILSFWWRFSKSKTQIDSTRGGRRKRRGRICQHIHSTTIQADLANQVWTMSTVLLIHMYIPIYYAPSLFPNTCFFSLNRQNKWTLLNDNKDDGDDDDGQGPSTPITTATTSSCSRRYRRCHWAPDLLGQTS